MRITARAWAVVRHNPWSTVGCVALALSLIACGALFPIYHRQSVQAQQGQMARDTQNAKFPVSLKLAIDGWHRGVITDADLACFRSTPLCPARTAPTPTK